MKNSTIFVFNQDAALRYTWIHNFLIADADKNVLGKTESGPMQVVSGPIGREKVHYEAPSAGRIE